MLACEQIRAAYGPRPVLHGCDAAVAGGEIVAMFGHNGAGKTTLLRVIAGLKRPLSGSVRFDGRDVTRLSTSQRARSGLALVPDGANGVFSSLTVAQNLAVVSSGKRDNSVLELVTNLFPVVMKEKRKQVVSRLSGGQRQMVALALAIAREPRVLLLDEPSLGLAPVVVEQMMQAVKTIATTLGTGVLVVEQEIPAALAIADRVQIMKQGSIVLSLPASQLPSAEALWEYF